jgi:hypothetical protein
MPMVGRSARDEPTPSAPARSDLQRDAAAGDAAVPLATATAAKAVHARTMRRPFIHHLGAPHAPNALIAVPPRAQ